MIEKTILEVTYLQLTDGTQVSTRSTTPPFYPEFHTQQKDNDYFI